MHLDFTPQQKSCAKIRASLEAVVTRHHRDGGAFHAARTT
jgi:hypothetical protein